MRGGGVIFLAGIGGFPFPIRSPFIYIFRRDSIPGMLTVAPLYQKAILDLTLIYIHHKNSENARPFYVQSQAPPKNPGVPTSIANGNHTILKCSYIGCGGSARVLLYRGKPALYWSWEIRSNALISIIGGPLKCSYIDRGATICNFRDGQSECFVLAAKTKEGP